MEIDELESRIDELEERLNDSTSQVESEEAIDDYAWHIVTPERLEKDWENDERLKKTDEIKAKYKNLVKNNRVVFFEINWN